MTDHSLETVRLDVIDALNRAATISGDPFRTPVLATIGADGAPEARVIVVRAFDAAALQLTFFTDTRSPKVAQIRKSSSVSLTFYDASRNVQLRIGGAAHLSVQTGDTAALWEQLPEYGRGDYLTRAAPGSEINTPADGWEYDHSFSSDHFCVVRISVREADWLKLSSGGHKRAKLVWKDGSCQGRWLTP